MFFKKLFGKNKAAKSENTEKTAVKNTDATHIINSKTPTEIIDDKTREQFMRDFQKAFDEYKARKMQSAATSGKSKTIILNKIEFVIKDNTILTSINYPDDTTKITVPDGLVKIGERAFQGCSSLKEITLPPTITHIEREAFKDCQNLKSISIPVGIDYIGTNALKCTGKVFLYSDKGKAQVYPYCEGDKRTGDIINRINLMTKGNYSNPQLSNGTGQMHPAYAFDEALKLASSYYIITEDKTALDFILSNMKDLIVSIQDNTDELIKKLIEKKLIDDETLLKFIKIILRYKLSKYYPEFRVLSVIIDYMKNQRNIGLYEFSRQELIKYIRLISPVPWEKVYFRVVTENDTLRFNYCYIEKDTGFIVSMSTEEKRYGYILDYRRDADIREILNDRCKTFCELYNEKNSDKPWKSATFTVECSGKSNIEFEFESVTADEEWENTYTGGISRDFSTEYPVCKLKEESESQLISVDIPFDSMVIAAMTVWDYYVLLKKCCDYLGDDYMTMKLPVTAEQIDITKRYFSAEPDKNYIEWLSLCSELTINDWIIYDINSCLRDERGVGSDYIHIASDICSGYGISYETGKCRKFDRDFGNEDCSFLDILNSVLEAVRDCISEVEGDKEEEYLIRNHRALSDSYAEFLVQLHGSDTVKHTADMARIRQYEEKEKHSYYYDDIEIVKEYKEYINKVCNGECLFKEVP